MNTSFTSKSIKIQVTDRDALCKALAEEMGRVDAVNYAVYYTTTEDADAGSAPAIQKHNAKQISMSIVRRVALKCPKYQWIRKTAQVTPHTIRNGFVCALAEEQLSNSTLKSCNGWLFVTVNRRVPGQLSVSVTLDHDFGHDLVAVSTPALGQRALTQGTLVPKKDTVQPIRTGNGGGATTAFVAPRQERGESIAKDILRALGRRPRTPEPFKPRPGKPVDENAPFVKVDPMKQGRGRPKKEVDPDAPVKVKSGLPRGRPRKKAAPALVENRTLSNHGGMVIGTIAGIKVQNKIRSSGSTVTINGLTVQM